MPGKQHTDARRQVIASFSARFSAREQRLNLIARQRLAAIRRFTKARSRGVKSPEAVRLAGASGPSLSRWKQAHSQYGLEGLVPGYGRCGRKSELMNLRVPKWTLRGVERIALQKCCAIPAAWREFARSAACPPRIAARIRKGTPPSFLRATALRTVKARVRFGRHVSRRESLIQALKEAQP